MVDLLKANGDLHSVRVFNDVVSRQREVVRAVASLITRIAATKVKELTVHDWYCKEVAPLTEDACLPLRFRGVDVRVGSVQYMPKAFNLEYE